MEKEPPSSRTLYPSYFRALNAKSAAYGDHAPIVFIESHSLPIIKSMKTLLILGLFFSLPSLAGYSASDDGACLNPEPIATLNVEEASCVGKPCECYTRVYREQILGLEEKRVEKIDQALEKTYIEAATGQMRELMDLDILVSAGEGKILDSTTNLARSCSFDSLASVLTCKNAKARRVSRPFIKTF